MGSRMSVRLFILFTGKGQAKYTIAFWSSLSGRLELLLKDPLQSHRIRSEFRNTLPQFLNSHGLLIEIKAELGLIVEVRFLLDAQARCVLGVKLLRNGILRVV